MATVTTTSSTPPSSFEELVNKYMLQLGARPTTNIEIAQARQQGAPQQQIAQSSQSNPIVQGMLLKKMLAGKEAADATAGLAQTAEANAAWNAAADTATAEAAKTAAANAATEAATTEAAPSILTSASELGVGPLAGIAAGTYLGGKAGLDMLTGKQKNWKDASLGSNAGRLTLGIATGGLSEVANKLFGGHKSTRQTARENTQKLFSISPEDTKWQDYVRGMRAQYDAAPTDPSKPFAGKYKNFEEYKKGGLEAGDLTGVLGNLEIGPEYGKASFDQQKAITQKLIDADQYYSKKGEVRVKDKDLAKQIAQEVLGAKKK